MDPVLSREDSLLSKRIGQSKVIESKLARQSGLIVTGKLGQRLAHVRPFSEALTPPKIVLRNWMKLGKEERDQPNSRIERCERDLGVGLIVRPALQIEAKLPAKGVVATHDAAHLSRSGPQRMSHRKFAQKPGQCRAFYAARPASLIEDSHNCNNLLTAS